MMVYERVIDSGRRFTQGGIAPDRPARRTSRVLLLSVICTLSVFSQVRETQTEANKTVVKRFFLDVQNRDRVELVDSLYAEGSTLNGKPFDREQFKERRRSGSSAFREFLITIDDLIAYGDLVVARTSATAINTGEWFGLPATDKRVHMRAIDYFRLSREKIAEHWHIADRLGTIIEMGYLPRKKEEKPSLLLALVMDYRNAVRTGDTAKVKGLLSETARRWFDTLEGPGIPVHVSGKGPWADWDKYFRSTSVTQRFEIDDSSVTVTAIETNDFYQLIGRKPTPVQITYFFDEGRKINRMLVFRNSRPEDEFDKFKEWAATRYPAELRYLMPEGEIIPTLDRAEKWKTLLTKWRKGQE